MVPPTPTGSDKLFLVSSFWQELRVFSYDGASHYPPPPPAKTKSSCIHPIYRFQIWLEIHPVATAAFFALGVDGSGWGGGGGEGGGEGDMEGERWQ